MKILKAGYRNHRFVVLVLFCCIFLFQNSGWAEATAEEIRQWIDTHNQFRALHQVGPVTWSDTVAASAQAFIDTCPSDHSDSEYGENLGYSRGYVPSISDMVTYWYEEEEYYDYSNPSLSRVGHFTQVVWKSTTEIGCALNTNCPLPWPTAWVCQYNPPGNYPSGLSENVFPKKAAGPSPPNGLKVVTTTE